MGGSKKLTPKQQRFAAEYIVDLNGTQAAIRAGYSERSATEIAYETLRQPHVAAEVQRLAALRMTKTELTAERVLARYEQLAFGVLGQFFTITEDGKLELKVKPDADLSLLSSIKQRVYTYASGDIMTTTEVKPVDQLGALRDLARYFKLLGADHAAPVDDDGRPEVSDPETHRILEQIFQEISPETVANFRRHNGSGKPNGKGNGHDRGSAPD